MMTFNDICSEHVLGQLTCFDRMIFRGYIRRFFGDGIINYLLAKDIPLRDAFKYFESRTKALKAHLQALADAQGRPLQYLAHTVTRSRTGHTKEELAKQIAERDQITEGLVCIFSALELNPSFELRYDKKKHRYRPHPKRRKCLHYYVYYIDQEFGFMHVRLQSWFPMQAQVYINGREWLCRRLAESGIHYARAHNKLLQVDDLEEAQEWFYKLAHRRLGGILNQFLRRLNPSLRDIESAGYGGYYWVLQQCEIATDILFEHPQALDAVYPSLLTHAIHTFGSKDVLRFLGRKLHGNFRGEVTSDLKRRREGWRIIHKVQGNSVKMYDCQNVLRIETTINNPSAFRVPCYEKTDGNRKTLRWKPMSKGIANLWHYAQNGLRCNRRYIEALAHVQPKGEVVKELDELCRSKTRNGRRYAKLQPLSEHDTGVFAAVLDGDNLVHGFRNKHIVQKLYPHRASSQQVARRRSANVSRLLRKLRGHGLIRKLPNARRYRVSRKGCALMSAAIQTRNHVFAQVYDPAA